jgi:cholesterol oxidase
MLRPTPYPGSYPAIKKLEALSKMASGIEARLVRVPVAIAFSGDPSPAGVPQQACTACGDCVTGCNVSAKNTLLMNYIPDAKAHGAEIFTGIEVRWLSRRGARWLVHYQVLDAGLVTLRSPEMVLEADIVVLSAGVLGTTEILLRSKAKGLRVSDMVGQRFSGNGNTLGYAYDADQDINFLGSGRRAAGPLGPVGPTITGMLDLRDGLPLDEGIVIEDSSCPSGLASLFAYSLALMDKAIGRETRSRPSLRQRLNRRKDRVENLLRGAGSTAMHRTLGFLSAAHDNANGRTYLDHDRLRISWPGAGDNPNTREQNRYLEAASRAVNAKYVRNPSWSKLLGRHMSTVHPLGGAPLGQDADHGAVNHKGQVFSGPHGAEVHPGLYACDASMIPRSLGVNPLLTITALAERTCALLALDRGWSISYESAPTATGREQQALSPGIRFAERMSGFFRPAAGGRSPLTLVLGVMSDDVRGTLEHTDHPARFIGTVTAPALSAEPLIVREGHLNLLVQDPSRPRVRLLRYRATLKAQDGGIYHFDGAKEVHDRPGRRLTKEMTTLKFTVRLGPGQDGPEVGAGVVRIGPMDQLRLLKTVRVTHMETSSEIERVRIAAEFGRWAFGEMSPFPLTRALWHAAGFARRRLMRGATAAEQIGE